MSVKAVSHHYDTYPYIHLRSPRALSALHHTLLRKIKPENHWRILDVGCGAAALMERFAHRYWHQSILAIDFSFTSLALARHHQRAFYLQADATQLPFKSGTFDLIISNGVIHHIPHYQAVFFESNRLLKPNAQFYFTIYNYHHPYRFLYRLFAPLRAFPPKPTLNILNWLYWPIYALTLFLTLHYLPNWQESRADLADRFFHPLVIFFTPRRVRSLAHRYGFKIMATSTHALGTMSSYLFEKL